jgi:hypothetical protein
MNTTKPGAFQGQIETVLKMSLSDLKEQTGSPIKRHPVKGKISPVQGKG